MCILTVSMDIIEPPQCSIRKKQQMRGTKIDPCGTPFEISIDLHLIIASLSENIFTHTDVPTVSLTTVHSKARLTYIKHVFVKQDFFFFNLSLFFQHDILIIFLSDSVPCLRWKVRCRPSTQSCKTSETFKINREEEKISLRRWNLSGRRHRELFLKGGRAGEPVLSAIINQQNTVAETEILLQPSCLMFLVWQQEAVHHPTRAAEEVPELP